MSTVSPHHLPVEPLSDERWWHDVTTLSLILALVVSTAGALAVPVWIIWTPNSLAPDAEQYLDQALGLIQNNSYYETRVDWDDAGRDARRMASGAATLEETHPAIELVLMALQDGHSRLVPAARADLLQGDGSRDARASVYLVGTHGYIALPGFDGSDHAVQRAYAEDAQRRIGALDQAGACGWLLDLRENDGASLWPMLGAVAPLLGDGGVGFFVDRGGVQTPWTLDHGRLSAGDEVELTLATPVILQTLPSVAVLTSARTRDAGEAVAVAFRGRPASRSFGAPTNGRSTANRRFELSDGAVLFVTTALTADRTGARYGGALVPDVAIKTPQHQDDATLAGARAWLDSQPSCAR